VSDEGIKAVASECSLLTELTISSNYGITTKGVSFLLEKCINLQKLDIGKTYLTDLALEGIRFKGYGKHLKEVRLFKCPNVSNNILKMLSPYESCVFTRSHCLNYIKSGYMVRKSGKIGNFT